MKYNINSATAADHGWRIKVTVVDAEPIVSFMLEVSDLYYPGGGMPYEDAEQIVLMVLGEVLISEECVVSCSNENGQFPMMPGVRVKK